MHSKCTIFAFRVVWLTHITLSDQLSAFYMHMKLDVLSAILNRRGATPAYCIYNNYNNTVYTVQAITDIIETLWISWPYFLHNLQQINFVLIMNVMMMMRLYIISFRLPWRTDYNIYVPKLGTCSELIPVILHRHLHNGAVLYNKILYFVFKLRDFLPLIPSHNTKNRAHSVYQNIEWTTQ